MGEYQFDENNKLHSGSALLDLVNAADVSTVAYSCYTGGGCFINAFPTADGLVCLKSTGIRRLERSRI